jgi:hypothetical protein
MHRWLGRVIVTTALVLALGQAAGSLPGAAPSLRHDRFDPGALGDAQVTVLSTRVPLALGVSGSALAHDPP